MGLKGYYLKSDNINSNYCVQLINMYTTPEFSADYSFNYNFYNDVSFNINGNINETYTTIQPYNSIVDTNLIYKDAYYRIHRIRTYEDISCILDVSLNSASNMSSDISECSICNGTGLTNCLLCNNTGTIKDLSNILKTLPYDEVLVDTYPQIYGDISYVDSSGIVSINLYKTYDCSFCKYDMSCKYCNINNKSDKPQFKYIKTCKLEMWISVYETQSDFNIYNNTTLDRLYFIKDISKSDIGNWDEYYRYVKPLIEHKIHKEIEECELYTLLDISSNLEDV